MSKIVMTNTSTLNTIALATCQMNILVVGGGGVGDNGGGGSGRIQFFDFLKHFTKVIATVINPPNKPICRVARVNVSPRRGGLGKLEHIWKLAGDCHSWATWATWATKLG